MPKLLNNKTFWGVLLAGLFILFLTPLAPAEAASFSGMYPANGAYVNSAAPIIQVNVADTVNLDKNSLTVTVNGKAEPTSFNFKEAGYYENEDYQEGWVVTGYVYNQGSVTVKPVMLADGPAVVAVSIKNINGVASNTTWTFNVNHTPVISDTKPSSALVGVSTTLSAKVWDNGPITQVKMSLNGVQVPAVFDAAAGTVSYTVPALTSGTSYNVLLSVTEPSGRLTSKGWYFYSEYYQDSQVTGLACRDCHSGVSAPKHPMNNCALCHSRGPIGDCDSCHGESHGYELVDNHNCTECHRSNYPDIPRHKADNTAAHNITTDLGSCQNCHQASLTTEHLQRQDDTGTPLSCLTCHKNATPSVQQAVGEGLKNCENCHSQANHDELHVNTVLDDKCTSCHINNLSREHLSNSKTQTKTLTCATCHNNQSALGAIAAGDQNCAACHSQGHNLLFAQKVPADIPLYPGSQWSLPEKAVLWLGESWMPAEVNSAAKLVISNRRQDVTGDQVWTYYENEMQANGWTAASNPPVGAENYSVQFTKGNRQATLWFFSGPVPGTSQPASGGCRIQILY